MKEVGRTVGKVQGIIDFVELSEQDQRRLKQEIKALKGETK
jgi:hypothetical protein